MAPKFMQLAPGLRDSEVAKNIKVCSITLPHPMECLLRKQQFWEAQQTCDVLLYVKTIRISSIKQNSSGIVLSSFTPPHVIPNMYDFLSSVEHNERYFENVFLYIQSEEG